MIRDQAVIFSLAMAAAAMHHVLPDSLLRQLHHEADSSQGATTTSSSNDQQQQMHQEQREDPSKDNTHQQPTDDKAEVARLQQEGGLKTLSWQDIHKDPVEKELGKSRELQFQDFELVKTLGTGEELSLPKPTL